MRTGLTISGAGHAAVLLWSALTLAFAHHAVPMTAVPIDVISTSDFTQMTNGSPSAKPAEQPKALAEKVGPATPVDDPAAKVSKKEVKAATDTPPAPEPKPPEPKAKKQPPAPVDPIADALRKDEDKKPPEPKKAEVKPPPPTPPKKPPQPEQPQFDARKVAALLDKRTPERLAAAGDVINSTVSQGAPTGGAATLSQSELDAVRVRLMQLWNPPVGAKDLQSLSVTIRFKLKPDTTLDGNPVVVTGGSGPLFMAVRDSAVRAVLRGQPYLMLRPEHYDIWQEMEITFDDSMLTRG
jgi:colicin import membrane protein